MSRKKQVYEKITALYCRISLNDGGDNESMSTVSYTHLDVYKRQANGRAELLKWLKLLKQEEISDIRKVYKSGVSDSVLETYRNYIRPA